MIMAAIIQETSMGQNVVIDFTSGKMRYRLKRASLKSELLAKALGCKPRDNPTIIDATAGLGRDSFILASLGFKIIMLERSPIVHAMLAEALKRAADDPEVGPIVERLTLIQADAIEWLPHHHPDVVYLDPMFPEKKKSASSKKEMAFLQELLGTDDNSPALLQAALTCGAKRIVVKRPRLAEEIEGPTPSFSLKGKSSRFDIYLR
jgi:16S rRNA (guanine1516-N2)-methyltransferase